MMAVMLEKQPAWEHLSSGGTCKRKFKDDKEMSSLKKRRPNAKSYNIDIYEQPRSMGVYFLNQQEMPSFSSYIVGERSSTQVQTDPTLLLSNFRGTVKLIWYLVADDVRYPHPYILEGDDCVEGVCAKTIKAKGEAVTFPGLSVRKVSWKEMEQVLSKRVDRLKQLVPEMEFRMKSLKEYNLRSVKICFQALPQDAVHDYSASLKPVMTRQIQSTDPLPLSNPIIMSISECKGTVHGKTEVTLLVSNLKTDDVLVFFYYASRHPRISWQAFGEIITVTPTKHRQASILIQTPPFHNRSISEPKTVNVEIRLRDNSCSNTVKYTFTPATQVVNRIQRRVKQKEPIFANYFNCVGGVTNVSPLVPTREFHQDDDKSTSDLDETPKITAFDIKPGQKKPKALTRKEDKILLRSTSLPLPTGQYIQERKSGGFDSEEEIAEADSRVNHDQLSRYLTLTNLNIPEESIPNGLPSHEWCREEPDKEVELLMEVNGASSCKTITEENVMEKLSNYKLHSPSRESSLLLREEGFHTQGTGLYQEGNTREVPYEDNGTLGKRVWEPCTDSGYSGFLVARCSNAAVVVPTCVSEHSDSSIYSESASTDSFKKKGCTSHAEEDGKSTPTSQTTSLEAVNATNDQGGAESNQNFGSSQHESESASKDGNGEGDSPDHNAKAEEGSFSEELRPPRATQRIDHRGGTISLTKCDVSLKIPPGALAEGQEEEIVVSVDWNDRHIPPLKSTDMNVAPIVNCYPTGLKFLKPVTLKIPHCAILPDPEKCKATVHCSQTDEGKDPDWKRLSHDGVFDVQVEYHGRYFHLEIHHFTSFSVTLDNSETTLAKEIMFVPYGKNRYLNLDDREIRLYLYDYHTSNSEKIHQEEQRFGGKMLDTSCSYQIVDRHKGSIDVKMRTHMHGWLLKSENKYSFSFKKVWNGCSWSKCKFIFKNITRNREFYCKIIAGQQRSEEDLLEMEICNNAQNSPENLGMQSKDFAKLSESLEQFPSTQSALPVAKGPGSYSFCKPSLDSASHDSGYQNHQHVHYHLPESVSTCPVRNSEQIIPYALSQELCGLLDLCCPLDNDWKRLAQKCECTEVIPTLADKQGRNANFSPTKKLLLVLEQQKKIQSLGDLKKLLEEIRRLDAADKVRKYMEQPNPSSSTLPALTERQVEQPMSTDNTPSPKDINQPLSSGGQARYDFQSRNDGDGTSQLESSTQAQSNSCLSPTALSNQEITTSNRPYTDYTNDGDSTPSNNNRCSNAARKELDLGDHISELQDGFNSIQLKK